MSVLCLEKPFSKHLYQSANRNGHSVSGNFRGIWESYICAQVCTWSRLARFHTFCYVRTVVESGRVKEFSTFCVKF